MRVGDDHWLIEEEEGFPAILRVPSVRTNSLDTPGPLGIVWHWAANVGGPHAANLLADSIRNFDRTKDRAASWHVLIAKDGRILQSVPFNLGSWHVGKPGKIAGHLVGNINRVTVGCELDNAGEVLVIGGKYYCWPGYINPEEPAEKRHVNPGLEIAASRVVERDGRFFDAITSQQEQAATRLLAALARRYKWSRSAAYYGHYQFDFPRKEDPGPLWMRDVLPRVISRVFGQPSPLDPPIPVWPPAAPTSSP